MSYCIRDFDAVLHSLNSLICYLRLFSKALTCADFAHPVAIGVGLISVSSMSVWIVRV